MSGFDNYEIKTKVLSGLLLVALISGIIGYMGANQAISTRLIMGALAALAIVVLGGFIARVIASPINKLVGAIDQVAQGNVSINLVANTRMRLAS